MMARQGERMVGADQQDRLRRQGTEWRAAMSTDWVGGWVSGGGGQRPRAHWRERLQARASASSRRSRSSGPQACSKSDRKSVV